MTPETLISAGCPMDVIDALDRCCSARHVATYETFLFGGHDVSASVVERETTESLVYEQITPYEYKMGTRKRADDRLRTAIIVHKL